MLPPPMSPLSCRRCQGPELDLVSGLVTQRSWSWDRRPPVASGKRMWPLHQQITELAKGESQHSPQNSWGDRPCLQPSPEISSVGAGLGA